MEAKIFTGKTVDDAITNAYRTYILTEKIKKRIEMAKDTM